MAAGTKITAGRELKFTDDLVVTTTNKSVSHPACYSLSGGVVTASPHTDQASHEVLLSETFGSVDWLWSADDEFRFGKTEGELRGLMLAVPEEVPGEGGYPERWLQARPVLGGMQLSTRNNFDARRTDLRWISASGDLLLCFFADAPMASNDILRLRVAPHLDLVFADHVYTGWILENPANHLVHAWEPAPPGEAPDGLSIALRDYLILFSEPKIDMMQDGDTALLAELDALLDQLAALPADPRRTVIHDQVADLRENWYGD
ncbi:hypothetical protein [Streptomyces sp. NBC_00057]|uniref:hypothetical protein n=1 Tax=Streptomyces sp. NBC_00057 TaxID=2975634 RepID=UPI00324C45B3